jgi:hypothetical protein
MTLYQLRQQKKGELKAQQQLKQNERAAKLTLVFEENARTLSKFKPEEKAVFYWLLNTKKEIKQRKEAYKQVLGKVLYN